MPSNSQDESSRDIVLRWIGPKGKRWITASKLSEKCGYCESSISRVLDGNGSKFTINAILDAIVTKDIKFSLYGSRADLIEFLEKCKKTDSTNIEDKTCGKLKSEDIEELLKTYLPKFPEEMPEIQSSIDSFYRGIEQHDQKLKEIQESLEEYLKDNPTRGEHVEVIQEARNAIFTERKAYRQQCKDFQQGYHDKE